MPDLSETLSGISDSTLNKVIVSLPQFCLSLCENTTKTFAVSHGFLLRRGKKSYWLRQFLHQSVFAATYHITKG